MMGEGILQELEDEVGRLEAEVAARDKRITELESAVKFLEKWIIHGPKNFDDALRTSELEQETGSDGLP